MDENPNDPEPAREGNIKMEISVYLCHPGIGEVT